MVCMLGEKAEREGRGAALKCVVRGGVEARRAVRACEAVVWEWTKR